MKPRASTEKEAIGRDLQVSSTQTTSATAKLRFGKGVQLGPYTLVKPLGRGSFGDVWLAEKAGKVVRTRLAIKLPNRVSSDFTSAQREAQLWVRAGNHPNILPMFDAEVYDGQVVIVSEYAPEGSLQSWLQKNGGKAPSLELAGEIMLGLLAGLEHLHVRGILHRDLKPTNILMKSGTPCLADFGISRLIKAEVRTFRCAGTPAYMAPEAFAGERSTQTDLWSAGVIMFQLIFGWLPFEGRDRASLLRSIMCNEVGFPAVGIPKSITELVAWALQKEPANRPVSATEMRSSLRDALRALQNTEFPTMESLGRTCTSIAITGSMLIDRTRAGAVIRSLVAPYCSSKSTWYCGSNGDVDELALEALLEAGQRLIVVGYHADDISPRVSELIREHDVPFVNPKATSDAVEAGKFAPKFPLTSPHGGPMRDATFATRADLVMLIWDGESVGTRMLIEWLQEYSKDHLVGFV
jgi:serine/threonine-protein kinase